VYEGDNNTISLLIFQMRLSGLLNGEAIKTDTGNKKYQATLLIYWG
jgi:hypothetical protein